MADLTDTIEDAAAKPQTTTVDGTTVDNRSLPDLIAADKHLRGQQALDTPTAFPMRVFKIAPPGGR